MKIPWNKSCRLMLITTLLLGCSGEQEKGEDNSPRGPLRTVEELLALHDLLGKQPEERSVATRHRPVARKALRALILDIDEQDPFIGNLYVGFVLGALSRYQTRLSVTVTGDRAEVRAGAAKVVLRRVDDVWRVVLAKSVPEAIKTRAKMEKIKLFPTGETV